MQVTAEMQRNGGLARAAKYRELRARAEQVWQLADALDRADVAPFLLASSLILASKAVSGELPDPTSPLDSARYMEASQIAHKIARLEMGESTSNAASLRMDGGDLDAIAARIAALRGTQPATHTAPDRDEPTQ